MLVPVHIASFNALCNYLASAMPDVKVEPRWPDPSKQLPQLGITIIPAGGLKKLYMDQPQVVTSEVIPSSVNKIWTFRIAEYEQPFQMDVWSHFSADRDDIVARLENYLNVGDSQLSVNSNNVSILPAQTDSLVLELADGWEGSNATYYFDESITYDDTPEQVARQEYRATYSGNLYCNLTKKVVAPQLTTALVLLKTTDDTTYNTFQ